MQWTEDLSVGIKTIDDQHKELFNRINSLVDTIKDHTCKYKIGDVIKFLEDYIVEHFSLEQKIMRESGYPNYDPHRLQHEKFIQNFFELKVELEKIEAWRRPGSYDLSVATNQIVVDWILDHISMIDKQLGEFLKKRG
ncbi:MAG: bacteriohemerythrin [Nitrospirota bacterium]